MRNLSVLLIAIIIASCNSQSHTKQLDDVASDNEVAPTVYEYGAGDVVYKGYLDHSGNIWFATSQEGVYKYDGQSFVNYNIDNGLCGNDVSTIIEDRDGLFWFGTENGLCKFDGKKFETIAIPKYPKKSEWLDKYYPMINPNAVTTILQDKRGDFWVGSNCAGLYRYNGNKYESYLQERGNLMPDSMHHNSISAIVEDKVGDIWIGSFSHGGVSQYNGEEFIHHALDDGIGDGMISSIYIDGQERMWVGTRNGGIYQYNGQVFKPLQNDEGVEKIAMAKFFEDSKGILWMSSYARKGVYQYDGEKFIPFTSKNSDKLIDVMCITEDKNGNVWFGGRYGLLWRYDREELKDFTQLKRMQ
ncbi:MAG: two-component regulator propeller domain-containing protein [Bacteroidota bacterium]